MSIPVIQVGNVGTVFRFTMLDQALAIVDISTATLIEAIFRRGDRTILTVTGTLTTDGLDGKFDYVTVAGDLNVANDCWSRQAHVVIPGLGDFFSNVREFPVKPNLVAPPPP